MKQVPGLVFVITGPSGSGKTTILKRLLKAKGLKGRLVKTVSFTTRPRRTGERSGRDYRFISQREFRQRLKDKKFLEWTKYLGYYYATPKDFIEKKLRAGEILILCLDLKGALTLKKMFPASAITVFIIPPSLEALRHRIKNRSRNTCAKEVHQRAKLAKKELRDSHKYDYCVINEDLAVAAKDAREIILAEISNKI